MYHPRGSNALEYVELFNTEPVPHALGGYSLTGSVAFTFASNVVLAARACLVVAADPAAVRTHYAVTNVTGPFTGALPDDAGAVRLDNRWGATLLAVEYSDRPPWPVAADGAGHSLVLARPDFGENTPRAWSASAMLGGSPGTSDPAPSPAPLRDIVINEFLAHTDPDVDTVELYNRSTQTVDVSGCVLSDTPDLAKFRIPSGTFIPAGGFLWYDERALGFRLKKGGDEIYLVSPDERFVVDAVRFAAQERGVPTGRFPDGAPDFHELTAATVGRANTDAELRIRDVVINEIMYHPLSGEDADEYIELYNRGSHSVDLGGWCFTDGVSFMFPTGTLLAAGGYLVVARDLERLRAKYPNLHPGNSVGNYEGRLSDRGERVALSRPDDPSAYVLVDEVAYDDGWGEWTDGGGSSLELVDPRSDNRRAANWAGSDETAKARWTALEHTGVTDSGSGSMEELNVVLHQAGECLVDNIELVRQGETASRVGPSGFESGLDGWTAWGNHLRSAHEAREGFLSAGCLHLRASGPGRTTTSSYPLNNYDRVWKAVGPPPSAGETFSIRARARWLCGWPYLSVALKGFWLEAAGPMEIPPNLGTPALPNSRFKPNHGPAIWDLAHAPVLPPAGEPVTIRCRVEDPDGVAHVQLQYRVDPATNYQAVAMTRAVPGDGSWTAVIPGEPAGALVGFRILAADAATPAQTNHLPTPVLTRDALVRFGEVLPPSAFGTYFIWVSDANVKALAARPNQSNEPVDITFVSGADRAVYNAALRYRGNYRAFTNLTDAAYALELPRSDRFLGDNELKVDIQSLQFPNGTLQQERHSYWLAQSVGHAASYPRFVHVRVNGSGLFRHDLQVATRDLAESWYHDEDPPVYKEQKPLDPFAVHATTGGVKKQSTYAFVMQKHRTTRPDYDYRPLYRLVDALATTNAEAYEARVAALADVRSWAGYFALNHAVGNVDSYGFGETFLHNLYAYIPPAGRCRLHLHDMDSAFASNEDALLPGPSYPIPWMMFRVPAFERVYWQVLEEIAAGPMAPDAGEPLLDAWYGAFVGNGLSVNSPDALDPNTGKSMRQWIRDKRADILSRLAATNTAAAFAVTSNGGHDFATDEPIVALAGTAPVAASRITVNGRPARVRFDCLSGWSLRLGLREGPNTLAFAAWDRFGHRLGSNSLVVTFTGTGVSPLGRVVITELMYHPASAGAEFIEIHNRSPTQAFDLGGWRLDAVDFTFDAGTLVEPGGYAVVAEGIPGYAAAYGNAESVAGEYPGRLANEGEVVNLLMPGADGGWIPVDQVTYGPDRPWPAAADGRGASLQVLDPSQDNLRPGNWAAADLDRDRAWRFASVAGRSTANARTVANAELHICLRSPGSLWMDAVSLVTGTVAQAGANHVRNGDFESPLTGAWSPRGSHAASGVSTGAWLSGTQSLEVVASATGIIPNHSVSQSSLGLAADTVYTLSYWYRPAAEVSGLVVEVTETEIRSVPDVAPARPAEAPCTPGAANSLSAALPPFAPVWINEVMPSNRSLRADNAGQFDPWVELYNAGTTTVDLTGHCLTHDWQNLTEWAFPTGQAILASQRLLIWADGDAHQAAPDQPHTAFRLDSPTGLVALVLDDGGTGRVLDAVTYAHVPADTSCGRYPEGAAGALQLFHQPTPGFANSPTSVPARVRINEWLADNESGLADPADARRQDWFELHNPDPAPVHLGGYGLADDAAASNRFVLPNGTWIPGHGFLLVWADSEPEQNAPGRDLHVDFRLNNAGESILLFAPDGTVADAVAFGSQQADVSEGRWPDSADVIHRLAEPTPARSNAIFRVRGLASETGQPVILSGSAVPGREYRLEHTADLLTGTWWEAEVVTAASDTVTFRDEAAGAAPHRFYRIRRVD